MDKDDLDTCLRFHKDLSTKIFEVANTRYHNFQKHVRTSSIVIARKRQPSAAIAAMSYKKTSVTVEDVEHEISDVDTAKSNSDVPSRKKKSVEIEDVEFGLTTAKSNSDVPSRKKKSIEIEDVELGLTTAKSNSDAATCKRRSVSVEEIELGILGDIDTAKSNSDVQSVRTNAQDPIPWFKYPLYFTISYQSYFVKALTFISNLFNIILCIIIPYEVCIKTYT